MKRREAIRNRESKRNGWGRGMVEGCPVGRRKVVL